MPNKALLSRRRYGRSLISIGLRRFFSKGSVSVIFLIPLDILRSRSSWLFSYNWLIGKKGKNKPDVTLREMRNFYKREKNFHNFFFLSRLKEKATQKALNYYRKRDFYRISEKGCGWWLHYNGGEEEMKIKKNKIKQYYLIYY